MNGVKVKKRRQVIYLWGGRGAEMGEEKGKRGDSENKEREIYKEGGRNKINRKKEKC